MLENQGLHAIAFFEATSFVILLVLFILLQKDHRSRYNRIWLAGWVALTCSAFAELSWLSWESTWLRLIQLALLISANFAFVSSVMNYRSGPQKRYLAIWPVWSAVLLVGTYLGKNSGNGSSYFNWSFAILLSGLSLVAGWMLWNEKGKGYGAKLLAGVFMLAALHGLDRPLWPQSPVFLLRVAFDHLLSVTLGIAMVVLILEGARSRANVLNDKLHRLALLTASSAQTTSANQLLEQVIRNLVDSFGATHGLVRLVEGEGTSAQLVVHASVGFTESYISANRGISMEEAWTKRVFHQDWTMFRLDEQLEEKERGRMTVTGVQEIIAVPMKVKEGPLGVVAIGSTRFVNLEHEEIAYLINIANLLAMTLQNVRLFKQVDSVQRQWAYTFDSIGDPILVHDPQFRIVRLNHRLKQLVGREGSSLIGRIVADFLPRKNAAYENCPYCEGVSGEGDDPDPWLPGYFLASNSSFTDPSGRHMGTVHVLKDITERKRAEEKYRTLVSNVQEGVFISTPMGRFLDFNEAFLRISGYATREELMAIEIPSLYVNPGDRERLKKLLHEHGSVADFEFEIRGKDGEVRNVMESSIAVRDSLGVVTAYQGFLLDITERKRAELEIRRRNRELMVLNSIAQTLSESLDFGDSLHRTLRQMAELFSLDATSLYLFDEAGRTLKRVAAVGHRSEYARNFPITRLQPELLNHIKAVHATFLSVQGLPLPQAFRDAQRREGIVTAYVVVLWSKDKVIGGLVVGSRVSREFSAADINLLIAVGSQIASAIERTLLYEQTRHAYDDLRRTQEQLLHSEKMAAVGQLISGVAHELNNPLTAILGYSQLLISNGQVGSQGAEYADKLYKQAQRTHRIVQNLLSFARQHKPERVQVQINSIVEDTLSLRDYDLRVHNIRVHLEHAADLPLTAADPHQLQQVFLNLVNNAVDAILEKDSEGDLWVRTGTSEDKIFIEFLDSGPGVKDASRVFDPFYTTKPVGKGTGLGLSICYGIITEHGGNIRVRNVEPHGACFRVELPCQSLASAKVTEPEISTMSDEKGVILLLDEDKSVLDAVQEMLREKNHVVRTAADVREAQELTFKFDFDAVLADWGLVNRGGFREWLSQNRQWLIERLIVTRAGAPDPNASSDSMKGAELVLQKPFQPKELLAAVESVIAKNKVSSVQR